MKPLILIAFLLSGMAFAKSYTDTMTYTFDGITTIKTQKYVYNDDYSKLLKVKTCTTLIDTDNEEVISKKCTTNKY